MPRNLSIETAHNRRSDDERTTTANELASEVHRLRVRVKELEISNKQSKLEEINVKHKLATAQATHNSLEIKNGELQTRNDEHQHRDQRYRELFDLAPVGYLSITSDSVIEEANLSARCFLKSMGITIIGKDFTDYLSVADGLRLNQHLSSKVSAHLSEKIELDIQLPDGTHHPVMLITSAMRGRRSLDYNYQVMIIDISEQIQNERLLRNAKDFLEEMALHDSLTTLPNRMLFRDRLQTLIDLRMANREKIAVIYIDLDGFKPVNDSLGHAAGDTVLKAMSDRVKKWLKSGDTMARLGGDEFAVIMDNPQSTEAALAYAQSIAKLIREPIAVNDVTVNISSSMGVAMFPEHASTFDALVKGADAAMYRAKQTGKDQVVLFARESFDTIHRQSQLETSLSHAVSDEQLVLHYQPIYDTSTGKISSLEALLRWEHPTLGTVQPNEFIPIAEKTDHIVTIGDWVLDTACCQAKLWELMGLNVPIAINVSARQLMKEDFSDKLKIRLLHHSLPANAIEIEITETAVLIDHEQIERSMTKLCDAGHTLTIDDFGTGNSSLSRLVNLPVSRFKIDKMFTKNLMQNSQMKSLITSLVHMAHQLGLEVVAEGVEQQEQADFLTQSKCDAVQGFMFCKAEEASQITNKLRHGYSATLQCQNQESEFYRA